MQFVSHHHRSERAEHHRGRAGCRAGRIRSRGGARRTRQPSNNKRNDERNDKCNDKRNDKRNDERSGDSCSPDSDGHIAAAVRQHRHRRTQHEHRRTQHPIDHHCVGRCGHPAAHGETNRCPATVGTTAHRTTGVARPDHRTRVTVDATADGARITTGEHHVTAATSGNVPRHHEGTGAARGKRGSVPPEPARPAAAHQSRVDGTV